MKQRVYISLLWLATLFTMISWGIDHHHHFHQICMEREVCPADGRVNDKHTAHPDKEEAGCQLQQMHTFLVNARQAVAICKALSPAPPLLTGMAGTTLTVDFATCTNRNVASNHFCSLPSRVESETALRRGPPAC